MRGDLWAFVVYVLREGGEFWGKAPGVQEVMASDIREEGLRQEDKV